MCLTGGAVTAQAPAGQAAAGRAAQRLTVAIATTPDLGAAQSQIPPTNGQVPPRRPANLLTTSGTHEVQVRLFFFFFVLRLSVTFNDFVTLPVSHVQGVNSLIKG